MSVYMPYILPDGVPETICQNSVSGWGSLEGSNLTVYVYVYIYIHINTSYVHTSSYYCVYSMMAITCTYIFAYNYTHIYYYL
jgi:hypothetical protein